jgi:hypothetical protein
MTPLGRFKAIHILTLWPALILWPIVAFDYSMRRAGLRPDRFHWADALMLRLGWVME